MPFTSRPLDASTWDAFAELVERNNGVFGGCWCLGFHPESRQQGVGRRTVKEDRVRTDRAHVALVLDEGARQRFAAATVPVPEGVSKGVVHLTDERRYGVPVVLVCPEFSPAQVRDWIAEGELAELAKAEHLELVDIDSGHWPMLTRPAELAELLAAAATSVEG